VSRPCPQRRLSSEFLEDIAREYLTLGPGYSRTLSISYQVSPRTVVSWVEKARSRGILSPAQPGRHGGQMSVPPLASP
jgi:transposase-like protein